MTLAAGPLDTWYGRDDAVLLISRSPLFDPDWYRKTYPDVVVSGIDPARHYLMFGVSLGRNPGPAFDTLGYLAAHRDVKRAGLNPLLHYEQSGRIEGRRIPLPDGFATSPAQAVAASGLSNRGWRMTVREARKAMARVTDPPSSNPRKMTATFDTVAARRYAAAAEALYDADCAAIKVSVVMPTYNRAGLIGAAVRSVLTQSHSDLELLVVDDGSTDDTIERLARIDDPRLRVFEADHRGVSAARNVALNHATGSVVFYLDSDNTWTHDHVKLMLTGLHVSGADCAYAASCLVTETGELLGYRGEPFDWRACLSANYVDMNVFAHRIGLVAERGGFDEHLRRVVDWDLILRYSKGRKVAYLPYVGCLYLDSVGDANRITVSQPYLFRKVVAQKNRLGRTTAAETWDALSLSFAIKIAAPYEKRAEWGDFHYADSLSDALKRRGHDARIDFRGDWSLPSAWKDDVALVIRGLEGHRALPSQITVMWNISHPDQVPYEEYAACNVVMVASRSYAALLSLILERPVHALLQCTDTERFHLPQDAPPIDSEGRGLFVGNSRREYRQMVRWSVENGVEIDIYGTLWEDFIPPERIAGQNVPNTELSAKYRSARFVLNDHWQSMKDFGFVSNRVFDVLASGGRLVSDRLPSVDAMFGDAVATVETEQAFLQAVKQPLPADDTRRAAADHVAEHESFNARAGTILDAVREALLPTEAASALALAPAPDLAPAVRRRTVGLLLQRGRAWWTSSAFIRLIGPLTTDHAHSVAGLDPIALDGPDDPRLDHCDICIVQRVAVSDPDDAARLIDRLRELSVPLYVDTDDAFHLHDDYRAADAALRRLMDAAQEVWFSTPSLAKLYPDVARKARVRRNDLDPRFWRDYRNPVSPLFTDGPIRFLYMGTATHHADLQLVLPAFERLAATNPGQFILTLIGVTSTPPEAEWLEVCSLPQTARSYPGFARYVTRNLSFDVGLAPLARSPFNGAKSDVKFLDYCAMGLLSVVSEGEVYGQAVADGLAIGCGPSPDAWYDALAAIVERRNDVAEMRRRAVEHLWVSRNVLTDPHPLADLLP